MSERRRARFVLPQGPATVAVVVLALLFAACSRGYAPGLGELMSLQQMRHEKLWRAAQAENWDLAAYELDELQEGFDDVVRFHPTHKDAPSPLSGLVPKLVGEPIRAVRAAIDSHDSAGFATAYDGLTRACNACHQATNFGFNVVRRPQDATWFGNQEFGPAR